MLELIYSKEVEVSAAGEKQPKEVNSVTPTGKTQELNGLRETGCCVPVHPKQLKRNKKDNLEPHLSLGNIFTDIAINLGKDFR